VELAELGDMLKSLKDEYTGASTTLSEMESVCETCSGRLSDWSELIRRINGVFDGLSEPSSSSPKEEQQKAAETRLWSIVTGGALSLGLCQSVFNKNDGELAEKLTDLFVSFGLSRNGETTRTSHPLKEKLTVIN
jgi:hypothetical protein